jgi:hypothetical protein
MALRSSLFGLCVLVSACATHDGSDADPMPVRVYVLQDDGLCRTSERTMLCSDVGPFLRASSDRPRRYRVQIRFRGRQNLRSAQALIDSLKEPGQESSDSESVNKSSQK